MPKITVLPHPDICPQGAVISDAPVGVSLCKTLLAHNIPVEHACEMSCACTTCHVIIRAGFEALAEATDNEEDYLDRAWGLEPTSRLSCQALLTEADLTVEIPRYSINHAKENH